MLKSKMVFTALGIIILVVGLTVQSANGDTGIIDNLVGRVCSLDSGDGTTNGYIIVTDVQPTWDEFGNETGHALTGDLSLVTAGGDWVIIEDDVLGYIITEDHIMLFQVDDDEVLRHFPEGEFVVRDVFAEPVGIRSADSQGSEADGYIIIEDILSMYDQNGNVTGRALVGEVTLAADGDTIIIQDIILSSIIIQDEILYLQTDNEEILRHYPSGLFIIQDEIDGI